MVIRGDAGEARAEGRGRVIAYLFGLLTPSGVGYIHLVAVPRGPSSRRPSRAISVRAPSRTLRASTERHRAEGVHPARQHAPRSCLPPRAGLHRDRGPPTTRDRGRRARSSGSRLRPLAPTRARRERGRAVKLEPMRDEATFRVKTGLAEMLKGGVIMDVVTPEQAKIAEDAGAAAVMALERVPADIRRDGGVARMSDPEMIAGIQEAVSIPVMAKARIGHFMEAQVLRGARGRLHRRVRGAHAGRRGQPHRQVGLQGAVRLRGHEPRRGAAAHRRGRRDDSLQGRGRHRRHRRGRPPHAPHRAAKSAG